MIGGPGSARRKRVDDGCGRPGHFLRIVLGLALFAACSGRAAAPTVAPLARDARFAPCVEEPSEGLLGEWEQVEVAYDDGRPSKRLHGAVLAFSPGGYVGWNDGCNDHAGRYVYRDSFFRVRDDAHTEMACFGPELDLALVTEWRVDDSKLVLVSPTERYIAKRSPYSLLTRRSWSLFSITELETGEVHEVDHYRSTEHQLVIETEADRRFTFTDFDNIKWSGSMVVGPQRHALELGWDGPASSALDSRRRIATHREPPRSNSPYPLGMAAELDWSQVGAFCLVEASGREGRSLMLELRGDKFVYTLSPQ